MILDIARRDTRTWRMAASLAQEVYRQDFGAATNPAPETFMMLTEEDPDTISEKMIGAVAGLSFADRGPLFSEHYFSAPVEQVLARFSGGTLSRSEIVEVGPLASRSAGAGKQLIDILPAMTWCHGAKAAVFTVSRQLRVMLNRGGIKTTDVCRADEGRLPAALRGVWGSYYDTRPVTVYVDLSHHVREALPILFGQNTTADLGER